jgi:hypothetical protein
MRKLGSKCNLYIRELDGEWTRPLRLTHNFLSCLKFGNGFLVNKALYFFFLKKYISSYEYNIYLIKKVILFSLI